MRSLVNRVWPFSVLHRIERKIDHMASQAEQLKAALDQIAGHYSGLKAGIESIQANLAAAQQAAKDDPMVSAALQEANDLNAKFAGLEDALKPHVDIPQTEPPAPAVDPNAPVEKPAEGGSTDGGEQTQQP